MNNLLILLLKSKSAFSNCREMVGLEKLLEKVFVNDSYNKLVRPVETKTGITHINTELKILQINVVGLIREQNLFKESNKSIFFF